MALATQLKRLGLSDRLVRRNPLFYPRAAQVVHEFDRWTAEQRARWIDSRLQVTLRAARNTRYGRSLGAPADLSQWPILEKETIRDDPDAFYNGVQLLTISATTSGTTGTPLRLRRSLSSVAYEQAVLDDIVARAGIVPSTCRAAVLRGDDVKDLADRAPPFWLLANGGKRLLFSANHLDTESIRHYIAALRDFKPQALFAYPTVLDTLCALMAQIGEQLHVPITVCSSEVLSATTEQLAMRVLGTRIVDYYGQAERVSLARGSPREGYRFLASYSLNELLPVESSDERDVYELVSTALWNDSMPLVRYRTGDWIRLAPGSDPEAVAAGRESFSAVIGRDDEYLLSPSGTRLVGINQIPRGVPGLMRAQFIQETPESVVIRVITAPEFNARSREQLLHQAGLKIPPSIRSRIETTDRLVRTAAGKAPLVMREFERKGASAAARASG